MNSFKISRKKLTNDIVSKQDFDDLYIEEGLEICKTRNFELLNNFSYDREKQKFSIEKISPDLKKIFQENGIKKSDLKDKSFALEIVKFFLQSYDDLQSLKNCKTFAKPVKNENMNFNDIVSSSSKNENKKEEVKVNVNKVYAEDSKSNNNKNTNNSNNKQENNQNKSQPPNVPQVPKVPSVPNVPTVPMIPKIDMSLLINTNVSSETNSTPTTNNLENELQNIKLKKATPNNNQTSTNNVSSSTTSGGNMFDEMKKVQLKKVESKPETAPRLNVNDRNFIAQALTQAINQRRQQLSKNERSDESDDEWSD